MTKEQAQIELNNQIETFISKLRQKAQNQFEHNWQINIPAQRVTKEESANHAFNIAFCSSFNTLNSWDCDAAIQIAFDVMQDANCHTECRELAKFLK